MIKALIFISTVFFCCCNQRLIKNNIVEDNTTIKGIKVSETLPFFNQVGEADYYDTIAVKIYYHEDMTMLALPYRFDSVHRGRHLKTEYRSRYFLYKKKDSIGCIYDKYEPDVKKANVDSMLQEQWIVANKLYQPFIEHEITLLSASEKHNSGTLYEKYSFKGKKDTTVTGIIYLSFTNKMKGIAYSLSRELDSSKGNNFKLFNFKMIYNPRYSKEFKMNISKAKAEFSIEEIHVSANDEITHYFEQYKVDSLKGFYRSNNK